MCPKSLHQSDKLPNATGIKLQLRASEKVKDVRNKKYATLYATGIKARQEISQ